MHMCEKHLEVANSTSKRKIAPRRASEVRFSVWRCVFYTSGPRGQYLSQHLEVYESMIKSGLERSKLTPSRAAMWMMHLDARSCEEQMKARRCFYATLSACQALCLPAGWLVVERAKPTCDTVGFSVRGIARADKAAKAMFDGIGKQWAEFLKTCPRRDEALQATADREAAGWFFKFLSE